MVKIIGESTSPRNEDRHQLDQSRHSLGALSSLSFYGTSDSEEESEGTESTANNPNTVEVSLSFGNEQVHTSEERMAQGVNIAELEHEIVESPANGSLKEDPPQMSETATATLAVQPDSAEMEPAGKACVEETDSSFLEVIGEYRCMVDIASEAEDSDSDCDSSSFSSSSSDESSSDVSSHSSATGDVMRKKENKAFSKKTPLCTKGEVLPQDLPPIEDLEISVEEDMAKPIGTVWNVVEHQVVVQALPGIPAIDVDSILFLDSGQRVLGQVFDVFGPVHEPLYVVRFNSDNHIKERNIDIGAPVFYAPATEHTKFVIMSEILKMRGSDASWEHNNEPPQCFLDFSDDEEERMHKKNRKSSEILENHAPSEFKPHHKRGGGDGNTIRPSIRGGIRNAARSHSSGTPWPHVARPFWRAPPPQPMGGMMRDTPQGPHGIPSGVGGPFNDGGTSFLPGGSFHMPFQQSPNSRFSQECWSFGPPPSPHLQESPGSPSVGLKGFGCPPPPMGSPFPTPPPPMGSPFPSPPPPMGSPFPIPPPIVSGIPPIVATPPPPLPRPPPPPGTANLPPGPPPHIGGPWEEPPPFYSTPQFGGPPQFGSHPYGAPDFNATPYTRATGPFGTPPFGVETYQGPDMPQFSEQNDSNCPPGDGNPWPPPPGTQGPPSPFFQSSTSESSTETLTQATIYNPSQLPPPF